jgi:hypothetical protein
VLVTALQGLTAKLGQAVVALVALGLLAGVWLAFFTFIPFDFHVR